MSMEQNNPRVKKRRSYDASARRARAQRTRSTILEVARRRFLGEGYATTTVAAIAADAGVSVETIYKAFGGKPGLVRAAVWTLALQLVSGGVFLRRGRSQRSGVPAHVRGPGVPGGRAVRAGDDAGRVGVRAGAWPELPARAL